MYIAWPSMVTMVLRQKMRKLCKYISANFLEPVHVVVVFVCFLLRQKIGCYYLHEKCTIFCFATAVVFGVNYPLIWMSENKNSKQQLWAQLKACLDASVGLIFVCSVVKPFLFRNTHAGEIKKHEQSLLPEMLCCITLSIHKSSDIC